MRLCHQPGAGKESEKAFSTFVALVRIFFFVYIELGRGDAAMV